MSDSPPSQPLTVLEDGACSGLGILAHPKTPDAISGSIIHNGLAQADVDSSLRSLSYSSSPPTADSAVASASASSSTTPSRFSAGQIQFQSHTIAPSPPLSRSPPEFSSPAAAESIFRPSAPRADDPVARPNSTAFDINTVSPSIGPNTPTARLSGGHSPLRLQTDLQTSASSVSSAPFAIPTTPRNRPEPLNFSLCTSPGIVTTPTSSYVRPSTLALHRKSSASSLKPVSRTPSLKTSGFHGFGSASAASSTVASPIISAMGDVTPLPSPLLCGDSPGPWKKLGRSPPNDTPLNAVHSSSDTALVTTNGESLSSALAHHAKRKAYAELLAGNPGQRSESGSVQSGLQPSHGRDRSLSEYVPDPLQMPRRMVTVSATHVKPVGGPDHVEASYEAHMRREPHLSEARGLTPVQKPPTPPPSESSLLLSDGIAASEQGQPNDQQRFEYFEAFGREDHKRRRWRSIKLLGQGTFSRVMLATNQMSLPEEKAATDSTQSSTISNKASVVRYDRRTLVAVKICEHGPKGGASEDRVEMSLKRELEIMQCINHPSLVRLKAWNIEPTRALLVLSYCPGGDLFDVASAHRDLLTPRLLARMFAEMVGAVRYLHHEHIVHRDIKLENVLVNLTPKELADTSIDWPTYPYSVTTLTDLGLSRRVADDEKLETRCGSDDYAAPEVIMGQPYDGRATDAWSLGVLLYALLEGRLPFDPNPGMSDAHRMRSRTSHRIARVEWRWIEFAGDDGDHEGDTAKFSAKKLDGVMELTEGLLRRARNRWSLDKVAETDWVRHALNVPGGLQFREEEEGEEIL